MRKSVILPGVAVAGGLVGLLVRRVYLAHGFEAGTGLPISGAPVCGPWSLSRRRWRPRCWFWSRGKHRKFDQCYTGAFSPDTTLCSPAPWPGRFSWPSAAFWPWPPGPAAPVPCWDSGR
ncbi:MAG: hypothetical protein ACLR1T_10810 [Evtepia gabavorous]